MGKYVENGDDGKPLLTEEGRQIANRAMTNPKLTDPDRELVYNKLAKILPPEEQSANPAMQRINDETARGNISNLAYQFSQSAALEELRAEAMAAATGQAAGAAGSLAKAGSAPASKDECQAHVPVVVNPEHDRGNAR